MENNRLTPRRNFLQQSTLGVTGMGLAVTSTTNVAVAALPADSNASTDARVSQEVDVLVVGGGTAGTIAAIQAARAGVKTLLVERHSQLGGTTTTGGVAFPGLFDAWGKQIIAGIGWELVRESVELDGGTLPDFAKVPQRHWHNQIQVNMFLYSILAEEKCTQAGVEIAYYESPQSTQEIEGGWQVDCYGFGTQRRVKCKQIIDCTGGAEVVGMLGLARLREDETQPGSMLFQMGSANDPGRAQLHALYIHGADSSNSRTVTKASMTGRRSVLAKVRNQKKRLMHLQPEPGFRETYRIVGETMITVNDYTSGRKFDDAIANAFYPVDLHTKTGVRPKPLKPGTVPTIPLGALIPKGSRNLMVAGRCLSSDRFANSGLRVQAPCMAMGQAAGVTAALAAKSNVSPLDVPLARIHDTLRAHQAIVPGDIASSDV
ncbi:FAD dependent oxidoreductase [Neorhodopirellula lusitana]|uniref:FAD dependent oxidoreductase n=1 Tax=Neorhodopirellula lusitana TaxID=445327 RepID=A0ABY1QJI5_9BACT|nr:FAD-dependent oxidoreductase [Neorhodopirellula lusitana]SMP73154.1 FAD dependent oxidoreductase [Neorhodopirellula lusitana]